MSEETIFGGDEEEENNSDPLKYPIGSSKYCTIWMSEGEDNYYFSVKVEPPFLGTHSFNVSATERSDGLVKKLGRAWKEVDGGDQ